MRTLLLTITLALLVVGCDGNKKNADASESKVMCSSTNDYEAGLAKGLMMAPPCDITNNGTYKDKCVGEYNSTAWTNCYGERTLTTGEKYRGGYLEGKANGKGEFLNVDGTRYLGYYEKGKRNGSGKEYNANGEVIKVGEWINGVFSDVAQSEQIQTNTQAQPSVSQTSSQSDSNFAQVFPFYAEITCYPRSQITLCINNLTLKNGNYLKKYTEWDLVALGGKDDGEVRVDRDLREIDIHLKRNYSLIVQSDDEYPQVRVRIFNRDKKGSANQVIFENKTTRKYEVIRFSN